MGLPADKPAVAAILEQGIQLHRSQRFPEAAAAYDRLLRLDPDNADALHLLGVIASQTGQHERAARLIDEAIRRNPAAPEFYNSLGAVKQAMGRVKEAVSLYLQAVNLHGEYLEAYYNLLRLLPDNADIPFKIGFVLHRQGKRDDAMRHYETALAIQPDHADALNNLGCAHRELGNLDEALGCFQRAARVRPDFADAHHNLGFVLHEKERYEEALVHYRAALSLEPHRADTHMDLGRTHQRMGDLAEAVRCYQRAVDIRPDHSKALYNWACALHELGRDDDAVDQYAEAVRRDPGHVEAHVNRAFILLLNGRYKEGWPEYEWRLQRPDWLSVNHRYADIPPWNDVTKSRDRILVIAEQGMGDTIQFSRYLPLVKSRCRKLLLHVQPELMPLFATCPVIDELITAQPGQTPEADAAVHIMSLAGLFGTTPETIPSVFPYLTAPREKMAIWDARIPKAGINIGIAWSGNPAYPGNRERSCPLRCFEPIADIPSVRLYSLQKGRAAEELHTLPSGMQLTDLGPDLNDFADTAAAVMHLDLIVSVDTAIVHLAGALNKPVWTLRYHIPYWVWGLRGNRTPWYPSMRIFRQQRPGDWEELFQRVTDGLLQITRQSSAEALSASFPKGWDHV
ncbi:MAG: tetratricopeptide repeat protein [Thermodesulfobacteriota bacterium]